MLRKSTLFIFLVIIVTIIATACGQNSSDQNIYPNGPVKIVVAYSPGGSSDKAARLIQPFLEKELGTTVVVENMPGAGGQVAATSVLREKADGQTILAVNAPGIYYTIAIDDAKYTADDLTPVWVESNDPIVFLTLKDSEWNNLSDFIESVKSEPGKYAVGFTSGGGQQAVAMWLKDALGLDYKVVSFDGGGPTSAALLGNHVDAIFGDAFARIDIREEAKCLGIAATEPNMHWPEGESFNEQLSTYGVSEIQDNFQARFGTYWVPSTFKNDEPEKYDKLIAAFKNVSENQEYLDLLKESGLIDSMVLKPGTEYVDYFMETFNTVKNDIAPLIKNN